MLNALSKPSEVNKIILEYEEKARYWFIRKNGGEQKYRKTYSDMLNKCMETRQTIHTDAVKYNPKEGINWLVWGTVKYYKEIALPHFVLNTFLYYETAASIGGYMQFGTINQDNGEANRVILYFSDHFFLRLKDRLGANATMQNVVKVFIGNVSEMVSVSGDINKGEKPEVMIKFPESYGFGVVRQEDGCKVFEIRTFLKRSELTYRKINQVRKLEALAKKCSQCPPKLVEMREYIDTHLNESGWTPDDWWKNKPRNNFYYV